MKKNKLSLIIKMFAVMFAIVLFGNQKALASKTVDVGVPVLLYHNVINQKDMTRYNIGSNGATISTEQFEKEMKYLKDAHYKTITLDQLYQYIGGHKILPRRSVVITFDDGLQSNYVNAYPILKKYNLHAVEFAITSRIKPLPIIFDASGLQFVNVDEVKKMSDAFEFHSHTDRLHGTANNGLPALTNSGYDIIKNDLITSMKALNGSKYLAYPFGAYNSTTVKAMKEVGMKMAFTTKSGRVKVSSNPYELKREVIGRNYSIEKFKKIIY
jgi:peptidoglycan/xylan/chitin deacetylase (PgdA/CDA1 family)